MDQELRLAAKKRGLRIAFEARQKDSWGKAILHLIPLYWIIYAFDRKTITPFVFSLIYQTFFYVVILFFLNTISPTTVKSPSGAEDDLNSGAATFLSWVLSPFGVYHGIRRAKAYAQRRLDMEPAND
jgi:hypothetical protein